MSRKPEEVTFTTLQEVSKVSDRPIQTVVDWARKHPELELQKVRFNGGKQRLAVPTRHLAYFVSLLSKARRFPGRIRADNAERAHKRVRARQVNEAKEQDGRKVKIDSHLIRNPLTDVEMKEFVRIAKHLAKLCPRVGFATVEIVDGQLTGIRRQMIEERLTIDLSD